MADLAALTAAVEEGNRTAAAEQMKAALDEGLDPRTILGAMADAMDVVAASSKRASSSSPRC